MSLRLSLNIALSLCACATAVCAQEPVEPPKVVGPMPPLTVPYTTKPLDPKTQEILDDQKLQLLAIAVKNVPASLMAYWIDPRHYTAPSFARGTSLLKSPLENFQLPHGVVRIEHADDKQKALLVLGTRKGVEELLSSIAPLDKPLGTSIVPPIELVASIYWIDSLASDSNLWKQCADLPRVAIPGELDTLNRLAGQDRASLKSLSPAIILSTTSEWKLRFAPDLPGSLPREGARLRLLGADSWFAPEAKGGSSYPFLTPGLPQPPRGQITVLANEGQNDTILLSVIRPMHMTLSVRMRFGDTLLLSGSATQSGIKPPSPRFDAYVLCLTPRSTSTVSADAPAPATP